MSRIRTSDWKCGGRPLILSLLQCIIVTVLLWKVPPMERIELHYELLKAAIARRDRPSIEVQARKLRDQHLADLTVRAVAGARSGIIAIGRLVLAWCKNRRGWPKFHPLGNEGRGG